jgi:hypothetical protein
VSVERIDPEGGGAGSPGSAIGAQVGGIGERVVRREQVGEAGVGAAAIGAVPEVGVAQARHLIAPCIVAGQPADHDHSLHRLDGPPEEGHGHLVPAVRRRFDERRSFPGDLPPEVVQGGGIARGQSLTQRPKAWAGGKERRRHGWLRHRDRQTSLPYRSESSFGASAVIAALQATTPSPEAFAAAAAFRAVASALLSQLQACSSGQELRQRDLQRDIVIAAELDGSDVAPVLQSGAFVARRL